MQNAYYNQFIN